MSLARRRFSKPATRQAKGENTAVRSSEVAR